MSELAYVCEGYLFIPNPGMQYPQEVLGSFYYKGETINVVLTKGNGVDLIRTIASDDVKGMDLIKDSMDPSIYYAVKKIEYMSKKEPVEIPFKIELKKGMPEISFDGENLLTIFLKEIFGQNYFYFPAPEGLSERVED